MLKREVNTGRDRRGQKGAPRSLPAVNKAVSACVSVCESVCDSEGTEKRWKQRFGLFFRSDSALAVQALAMLGDTSDCNRAR